MKRIAAIALALFLVGCVGNAPPEVLAKRPLILVCKTAGEALTNLAVFREVGAMSVSQIATVDSAILVIDPICTDGEYPSIDIALAAIERQLVIIAAMQLIGDR